MGRHTTAAAPVGRCASEPEAPAGAVNTLRYCRCRADKLRSTSVRRQGPTALLTQVERLAQLRFD